MSSMVILFIQAYKNVRLSFSLRCSPAILMIRLYKILILDVQYDCNRLKDLKKLIYRVSRNSLNKI